jgi:arylsulfatase A-like enzyme
MTNRCFRDSEYELREKRSDHMKRIVILFVGLGWLSTAGLVQNAAAGHPSQQRPNILFLFADDQCFRTIHAMGNEEIQTPNLDQLFESGTVFTNTYNQGGWNGAICVASRTMLATGRYIWHAHAAERDLKKAWSPKRRLWSQMMSDAGYKTYFTGKWHVKADNATVFDVSRHVRGGMPKQQESGYHRPPPEGVDPWSPYDQSLGGFWEGGTHWSEVVANDTIDYLADAVDQDKPFFMYIAFNAPHDPRQSPKEFVDLYPSDAIRIPDSFLPEYPFDIGSNKVRDEVLAPFPRTHHAVQVHRQEYYAIITHMDAQIGRILKQLDATGQRDNTWIFFTADHGLACGEHGLMGKQNQYDHSIRVPFVAIRPGSSSQRLVDVPIYLQSVMPTTLDLAGVELPERIEFPSLVPLLTGKTDKSNLQTLGVYSAYTATQRSLTHDGWKLVLYPRIGKQRLYCTADDPQELRDRANDSSTLERRRKLFQLLTRWQERTGDQLDVVSVYPDLTTN